MSVAEKLKAVPDVLIDTGVFKYIQIRVTGDGVKKIVIRGSADAEYHADVYGSSSPQIESLGFQTEPIGGGRIDHNPVEKTIHVYGYSMGYGRADHTITVQKLKAAYPECRISWSNEGY